jgi:ubiquinone/menaquinone biosynthesis C-methylase UbiE
MKVVRPYLDYYAQNRIIPVNQDLSDLASHLRRRSILYHLLHIPPAVIRGRRVLEIGPGTGDNAIYTASLLPDTYTLIDGNPYSIVSLCERIKDTRYSFGRIRNLQYVETDFLNYRDDRLYDLVLCEGVIPAQDNCRAFLKHAASYVDHGGILVITTLSATSILADICRRLVKPIFSQKIATSAKLVDELVAFFVPHLETLPGRSRVPRDWIMDNILQPWPQTTIFTIENALDTLDNEFDLYGTSPQFVQDFRWYKAAAVDVDTLNDVARRQIKFWSPQFIDYRVDPTGFSGFDAADLEKECEAIFLDTNVAWSTESVEQVIECVARVQRLGKWIASVFPRTATSISDFVTGMTSLVNCEQVDFGDFSSWFGRGQQYVSFQRR